MLSHVLNSYYSLFTSFSCLFFSFENPPFGSCLLHSTPHLLLHVHRQLPTATRCNTAQHRAGRAAGHALRRQTLRSGRVRTPLPRDGRRGRVVRLAPRRGRLVQRPQRRHEVPADLAPRADRGRGAGKGDHEDRHQPASLLDVGSVSLL